MTDVNMRAQIFTILTGDAAVVAALPGGIHEIGSLTSTFRPEQRPYAIVRSSFTQGRIKNLAKVAYMAVWVHDEPGSYVNIDAALVLVRRALINAPSTNNFLEARWLEDSIDFRDDDQGTIVRYSRFQLFHTTREG